MRRLPVAAGLAAAALAAAALVLIMALAAAVGEDNANLYTLAAQACQAAQTSGPDPAAPGPAATPEPNHDRQPPPAAAPIPQIDDIPADYLRRYLAAAARYQIDWALLAGIGDAESDHGRNAGESSAGALGPMQFLPATWNSYGVDGDNDGRNNIHDPDDAIAAAANYLRAMGVHTNRDQAIFAYNHDHAYVQLVERNAARYTAAARKAHLQAPTGGGPDPILACPALAGGALTLPPATPETIRKVLGYAHSALGSWYQLGGDCQPPFHTTVQRCDCSSLVMRSYQQIGVQLPRTAHAQWEYGTAHGQIVPVDQAQPGDIIAHDSYLGPSTIGHVGLVVDAPHKLMINAPSTGQKVRIESYADRTRRPMFTIIRLLTTTTTAGAQKT